MPKIKAVIFDVDGVLVDSLNSNVAKFQAVLAKAGHKIPSRKVVLSCIHLDLKATLIKLSGTTDKKEIAYLSLLAKSGDFNRPDLYVFTPKLHLILKELHKDYKLAIATNRFSPDLHEVLEFAGIADQFDSVVTKDDYDKPKPNPEALILAARKLGIETNGAVYVGDTHVDIQAAIDAGMKSIHLAATKLPNADININTFSDIPNAVAKLSLS